MKKQAIKMLVTFSVVNLFAVMLIGCSGDFGITDPYTVLKVSKKGCVTENGTGVNSLVLNVETKRLDDGRIQCVVTTVNK